MCDGDPRWQGPYCDAIAMRAVSHRAAPKEKSRQDVLEDADARMAAAVAALPPVNPRRKKPVRRTSEQVRRAAKRQMEEREALARRASPDWLKEGMDDEERFVASLKDSE